MVTTATIAFSDIDDTSIVQELVKVFSDMQAIYNASIASFASIDDIPDDRESIINAIKTNWDTQPETQEKIYITDLSLNSPLKASLSGKNLAIGLLVIILLSDINLTIEGAKAQLTNSQTSISAQKITLLKSSIIPAINTPDEERDETPDDMGM